MEIDKEKLEIEKILDELEEKRIIRENKICRKNDKIYKEQMFYYKYWS
jgi:hypothetical protein